MKQARRRHVRLDRCLRAGRVERRSKETRLASFEIAPPSIVRLRPKRAANCDGASPRRQQFQAANRRNSRVAFWLIADFSTTRSNTFGRLRGRCVKLDLQYGRSSPRNLSFQRFSEANSNRAVQNYRKRVAARGHPIPQFVLIFVVALGTA